MIIKTLQSNKSGHVWVCDLEQTECPLCASKLTISSTISATLADFVSRRGLWKEVRCERCDLNGRFHMTQIVDEKTRECLGYEKDALLALSDLHRREAARSETKKNERAKKKAVKLNSKQRRKIRRAEKL